MGKALILNGGTNGQYNIKVVLSRANINEKIIKLDIQIASLNSRIAALPPGDEHIFMTFQKNILIKQKEYLLDTGNMPDDPTISAWCVDFTENLTGYVGTIEVPGERGGVNILPGDSSEYNQNRDGQLQPTAASKSAAATFYNLALLPGWQKWMPNFRYAIITELDTNNNTCSVAVEPINSSQQNLNINYNAVLTDVPIEYMTCNAGAFEIGDTVVVQFTSLNTQTINNWETGKVIGFKESPRVCSNFSFKLTRGDGTLITEIGGLFDSFTVVNSSKVAVNIGVPTYDIVSEYWSFEILDPIDPNGYWVSYLCTDGIETQYPYRYKNADILKNPDLIQTGQYEDTIPYWKIETTTTIDGLGETEYSGNLAPGFGGADDWNDGVAMNDSVQAIWALFKNQGAVYELKKKVYSSVTYKLTRLLSNSINPMTIFYWGISTSWQTRSITYNGGSINYVLGGVSSPTVFSASDSEYPIQSISGVEHMFTITDNSSHADVPPWEYYVTVVPIYKKAHPATDVIDIIPEYDY